MSGTNLSRHASAAPFISAAALFAAASIASAQVNLTPPAAAPMGQNGSAGFYQIFNYSSSGVANLDSDISQGISLLNAAAASPPSTGVFATQISKINLGDGGTPVPNPLPFPSGGGNGGSEFATLTQGYVNVPVAGVYTFDINSDDGGALAFPNNPTGFLTTNNATGTTYNGSAQNLALYTGTNGGNRGNQDSLGSIALAAGPQKFVLVHQQGGGGGSLSLMSASGDQTGGYSPSTFGVVGQGTAFTVGKGVAGVGSFAYTEFDRGTSTSLSTAISMYNNGSPTNPSAVIYSGTQSTVNFVGRVINNSDGTTSNYAGATHGDAVQFPGASATTVTNDNNFGAGARATLTVPAGGATYTFDVLSDDSNQFRIYNTDGTPVTGAFTSVTNTNLLGDHSGFSDDGGCCTDTLGVATLGAGTYTLEGIFNQQAGGASFELYGATGAFTSYNANEFELLGLAAGPATTYIPGLDLVSAPEPASLGLLAVGAIGLLARRSRRQAAGC